MKRLQPGGQFRGGKVGTAQVEFSFFTIESAVADQNQPQFAAGFGLGSEGLLELIAVGSIVLGGGTGGLRRGRGQDARSGRLEACPTTDREHGRAGLGAGFLPQGSPLRKGGAEFVAPRSADDDQQRGLFLGGRLREREGDTRQKEEESQNTPNFTIHQPISTTPCQRG